MIVSNQQQLRVNPYQTEREYIEAGRASEILYIVPTNRRVRALRKSLLENSPNGVVADINVHTLSTFCTGLFFRDNSGDRMVTEAVSSVLLSQCFRELKPDYFAAYSDGVPRGTLDRIRNVINQYKRNGISPEALFGQQKELKGTEQKKAEAITEIYQLYKTKFEKLNVYDIGDVYESLLAMPEDGLIELFKTKFRDISLILIDGFTELTVPEAKIISTALIDSGVPGYIFIDYHKGNRQLFQSADEMIENLKAQGLFAHEEKEATTRSKVTEKFADGLFNYYLSSAPEKQTQIKILTGKNIREEVEIIAKEIKELVANKNLSPSDIGVVFNLIENYSPTVRDVFGEYEIAFNLSDRYRVDRNPLIISIINLLELSENDFYYKNLFRALSGNLIRLKGVKLKDFMSAASELKIVGGYKKWIKVLDRIMSMPEDTDQRNRISKEQCQKIEDALDELKKLLTPFNKELTFEGYKTGFYKLLDKLKIREKLLTGHNEEDEKNVKALKAFLRDMVATFALLEEEYGKDKKFSQAYFNSQLRTIITSSRYNIREKPNYGVLVTTPDEIRGLKFKVLFIGGLFENNFPTKFSPEIFMPESYRKSEQKHRQGEQYLFYQTTNSFTDQLYLTCPVNDEKKKLVRSNFLDECTRIFVIPESGRAAYSDSYYSRSEEQIYHGKLAGQNAGEGIPAEILSSVQIDKERAFETEAGSPYSGKISAASDQPETADILSNKAFSASALEMYAGCPFKYFAERVLRLRPVDEPVESIEPVEFGNLLHQVLFEFINGIIISGLDYRDYITNEFDNALDKLFSIAEEKIRGINANEAESFFEIEKILGIGGDRDQSILAQFLENEKKSAALVPAMAEKEFEIEFAEEGDLPALKLHGKIDRIDVNSESGFYKVMDYKSGGKTPDKSDLREGLSLQLPVYMLAAKKELAGLMEKEFRPAFPEIYSLKFGNVKCNKVSVEDLGGFRGEYTGDAEKLEKAIKLSEDLAESALRKAREYVAGIADGRFHLSRQPDRAEKVCKNCDHYLVCRVREIN